MGLHHSTDPFITPKEKAKDSKEQGKDWKFVWPNTADFNFNYYKLLKDAEESAIAENKKPALRIAIIGAGVAGLTAARELFRCGYTNIDIYEASDRIGGRTYSEPVSQDPYIDEQYTVFEMGAMRMPFFDAPGSRNSVLDYYRQLFDIKTQPFPDPGSTAVAKTGIYINSGYGPAPKKEEDSNKGEEQPHLYIWKNPDGKTPPPTDELKAVYEKWQNFAELVQKECKNHYGTDKWEEFWQSIVKHYWDKNFRELVDLKAIEEYDHYNNPGYFGGLGMDEQEADLFYTIGAGDGSWGAFYDIGCLYPIRTLLFGFGNNHQLIQGKIAQEGKFAPELKYLEGEQIKDSLGNQLAMPHFLGVQAFAECLFYQPVTGTARSVEKISLYQALKKPEYNINLYTQNPVSKFSRLGSDEIEITSPKLEDPENYDCVILTPSTWAAQMSLKLSGFTHKQLPFKVIHSIKASHWITSCKVFFRLKERYWENKNCKIPQLISTDTYLQGVYAYASDVNHKDPGVLLVSYTWEDDANKFIAEDDDDEKLAQTCLKMLDKILINCKNIQQKISPYVDQSQSRVIHWSKQPSYRGCAKLYRGRTWSENYALLTYNQEDSNKFNFYFAGEAFSVEGGWTEPALRTALDAVIHLVKNTGGEFLNEFKYADYPQYNVDWNPNQ